MPPVRRFVLRLLSHFRSTRAERELAREIESHLQLLEDGFRAQGMSAADARCAARRAFGGVEQAKEQQRDARSFRWLTGWSMDLKLGARMLVLCRAGATRASHPAGRGAQRRLSSIPFSECRLHHRWLGGKCMNRNDSSRLGDLQADGNLGNERNRSESGRSSERTVNRSSEGSMRKRGRSSERSSSDSSSSSEERSPSSESRDSDEDWSDGSER